MKTEAQMNDKELELISRSLDEDLSELEKRRLSHKILAKQEGVQAWSRYHAVSAVLRKQFPVQLDKDFSQRVLQEIESDASQHEAPTPSGIHRAKSAFRQIAGLAVAASVATVSVMSYQYFSKPTLDSNAVINAEIRLPTPVQPTTPNAVQSLPVEFSPAQLTGETQQQKTPAPQVEENIYFRQINPYIQEHSGFGSQRNMTPYVEIIELKEIQE